MRSALRRLLDGVIDYAGIYPPAKLPLSEAVRNYARFMQRPERWILSRFVCAASRLDDLAKELQAGDAPIPVTVIGTSGPDLDAFERGLEADSQAMTRFEEAVGERASVEAYEVRLSDSSDLPEVLRDLRAFDAIEVYLELPWDSEVAAGLAGIADEGWLGAKARTGGAEPSAFPTSDELALFLQQCLDLDLEFKLTAGLHHPLRRFDADSGARMHGFLNVLAAAALHESERLSRHEIATILDDEDAGSFGWGEYSIEWRGHEAGLEAIESMRSLFVGFGSCSVEEPLEDLVTLELIQETRA